MKLRYQGKWIFIEGTTDHPEICYNTRKQ
uniref:Uncharacterized protein n=1 Tax=Anguilla anguilla TaxID=7936 RepID=A0A0E9VWK6_ANGAN